jgi:hypothetical protein
MYWSRQTLVEDHAIIGSSCWQIVVWRNQFHWIDAYGEHISFAVTPLSDSKQLSRKY